MPGLVPKTRVAWALVVVKVNGVKSLHLIKSSYRGKISYYSKSARGVTDKIGFGEVVSCQAGARNEKDVRVDYLEFRNQLQQVANWKLEEFEPTLENGDFGRKLQMLRSNPEQLTIYLNHLIRTSSWNLHNSDLHTPELGEAKEENIYQLSEEERVELRHLVKITENGSEIIKSFQAGEKNASVKITGKKASKDQEAKKETVVNSKSGLEANFQKSILGFEQIDVDKISPHKGIIDEKLERKKIEALKPLLISQFDPKLSVITVAPSVKTADEYHKNDPDTTFKVLEGRYVLMAMKELYGEGRTFKGLESGRVMVVIVNTPGVIAANYTNFRQKHLSDQQTSHINIQDFVKLLKRIKDVIKDTNQAVEIVKNNMLTFNFHKDDITAMTRIAKWSEPNMIKLMEVFFFYENFQSLDCEKKKKSFAQLMKTGRKLAVPKLTFHRIAKFEEDHFLEAAQQVLSREISLADLATWSINLYKLDDLKQQCLNIVHEAGEDNNYEVFEDLQSMFPDELSTDKLVGFSKSVKGETFKTGDRIRLEKHILETVRGSSNNNNGSGTIEFEEMDNLKSSFFTEANCVILNTKVLSSECSEYFVKKVLGVKKALLVICKSQKELHQTIENIQLVEDKEAVDFISSSKDFKLFTLAVKDHNVKSNEGSEVSSCGLVFVILTGDFEIKNPPLKMFYEGLSSCLSAIVEQVTPQGGKVVSVNYMGVNICVIPPVPHINYIYYGSGSQLRRANQITAGQKYVLRAEDDT